MPHGTDAAALLRLLPVFLSYVLSFIFLSSPSCGWFPIGASNGPSRRNP